ncbi:MAG: TolB family protein [Actinomycetota bacterium]
MNGLESTFTWVGGRIGNRQAATLWLLVLVLTVAACGDGGSPEEPATSVAGEVTASSNPDTSSPPETTSTTAPLEDNGEATSLIPLPVGKLVFDSDRSGNLDLWLLEEGSTEPIQLTEDSGSDRVGTLTNDGEAVIFSTDRAGGPDSPTGLRRFDLYQVDIATGEETHLLGSRTYNSGAVLSPDGSTMAFSSDASGSTHIYLAGPDASSPEQITDENATNSGPEWSPDGTQIVYSSHSGDSWDIWIMNADGSDRRPLIEDEADSSSPAWSPDGTRIVFHSDQDGEADNLYSYDLDTEEITQLTSGPASDRYATWSPDGEWIAFDSDRDGDEPDIYILSMTDGTVSRLTDDPARDAFPDWGE